MQFRNLGTQLGIININSWLSIKARTMLDLQKWPINTKNIPTEI